MDKSLRFIALPVYSGKMVTEVGYDWGERNELAMSEEANQADLDEALLTVWREALVERKKRVRLGDDSYPVQHTAKSRLAQIDFEFAGQRIRGLEQNPATASRWAELARKGANVMQFLINGRYFAAISGGKITHFGKR
jgi:hypothetical protein